MLKINLYGTTFAHHTDPFSSCHKKAPRNFEWDRGGNSDVSIHVDDGLFAEGSPTVPKERRFGWLLEAEGIVPHHYANAPRVLDHYNCIFTSNESLLKLDNRFKGPIPLGMMWIDTPKIFKKTKLVSMIASNKSISPGHAYRIHWVERLRDKVDFYGRGVRDIENKEEALKDYMFSVAIENSGLGMSSINYFTEKLLDCFATGTIPVYLGCSNIEKFFNPSGIIKLDHTFDPKNLTADLYYSKMDAIKENFEKCEQYAIGEDLIYNSHLQHHLNPAP
jgi:hypothetical protein